jgi:uncharacterized phage infection (PIP) family protein YhgE
MTRRRPAALRLPDGSALERQLADAATLVASVRETLADMLDELRHGGGAALKEVTLKQAELESALRRALEIEARWHDFLARQGHAGPEAGLDDEALREALACRLQRLRDCGTGS